MLRTRYIAVIISGVLAALGGAYLSIGFVALVQPEHDRGARVHRAGRGDLRPLAPVRRARGDAAVRLLQRAGAAAARVLGVGAVLFQALPYVLTLIAVAGLIGRSRPPGAVGVPYVKE